MPQYPELPQFEVRPGDFDRLLNGPLSYRALYRRALMCPCWDESRGSPDYHCPVCSGVGYTWAEPPIVTFTETHYRGSTTKPERFDKGGVVGLVSVTDRHGRVIPDVTLNANRDGVQFGAVAPAMGAPYTVVFKAPEQGRLHAQGIRTDRQWLDRGEVATGDLECSIPRHLEDLTTPNPAWLAAEHDRFAFPDLKRRYQQRVRRGSSEQLTYTRVSEVLSVHSLDGAVIRTYQPPPIVAGRVAWTPGTPAPPAQSWYVIQYIAAPEYFVFREIPQQRHIDGHDLPRRVGLRLFESYPHRGESGG